MCTPLSERAGQSGCARPLYRRRHGVLPPRRGTEPEVNFEMLDRQINKAVVYLDPHEFQCTWIGNKAVYRTRMALADDGELIMLAPGVKEFGEDKAIDALIRKYGYCGTPFTLEAVEKIPISPPISAPRRILSMARRKAASTSLIAPARSRSRKSKASASVMPTSPA